MDYHYISAISIFLLALTKFLEAKLAIYLNLIGGIVFSTSLYLLAMYTGNWHFY